MLALTRKIGQSIMIGENIEITVVEVRGDQVKLAVQAPRAVPIYRKEIYEQIIEENLRAVEIPENVDLSNLIRLTQNEEK
ncbi:MAG: carbon storage regulator [Firmicutes bacterium HGW-Firmicutes-12]|jgi:carbon storage regulator|nr:MAG: carbon storage regulator [Firmicutes bacterium HGW-Firmicutes-12]